MNNQAKELSQAMVQGASYTLPALSEYVVTEINYEHFTAECCAEDDFAVKAKRLPQASDYSKGSN